MAPTLSGYALMVGRCMSREIVAPATSRYRCGHCSVTGSSSPQGLG